MGRGKIFYKKGLPNRVRCAILISVIITDYFEERKEELYAGETVLTPTGVDLPDAVGK